MHEISVRDYTVRCGAEAGEKVIREAFDFVEKKLG